MAVLPDALWSVSYMKSLLGNGCGSSNCPWCSALWVSLLCILKGDGRNGALSWFLTACWLLAVLTSFSVDCGGVMDRWARGEQGLRVCDFLHLRRGKDYSDITVMDNNNNNVSSEGQCLFDSIVSPSLYWGVRTHTDHRASTPAGLTNTSYSSNLWRFSTAWYGKVRYSTVHFWGVFHWVLYLVPDTFLVPLRSRFQVNRTVTKTWRVNSADHWLAGENRHYCVTELATRDPPLQSYPLDLNQHSQRRIGRNFCLNKRTFLHQPQNSSVVVCWGSTDVPLVDSRGADPVRAWWHDAEGKSLMYNVTFELAIFSEYVFCLYFTSVSVFCFN